MRAALQHLESLGTDCQCCVASEMWSGVVLMAVLLDCVCLFQTPAGIRWQPLEIVLSD